MKARLANVIGKKISISFKNGDKIKLDKIFPTDTELEQVEQEIDWESLIQKHGQRNGWGMDPIYDTPSGELEPGCLYWNDWYPKDFYWDNQQGPMLCAVLPNGHHWNIDSRASNCTMKHDRNHRCWCRHGEPPNITVDKKGHTCSAGAGSIAVPGYHGFLRNGNFTNA
jgi:hypothetical protein